MSAIIEQARVFGLKLVVGPDLDDDLAVARALGGTGMVFHRPAPKFSVRLVDPHADSSGHPILIQGTACLNDIDYVVTHWGDDVAPVLLVRAALHPLDLILPRCPSFLLPTRSNMLDVYLVLSGAARRLDTREWLWAGPNSQLRRTDGRHARLSLAVGLATQIREAWYADGGPEAEDDDAAVAYWAEMLQAPPALCRHALSLLEEGEGR